MPVEVLIKNNFQIKADVDGGGAVVFDSDSHTLTIKHNRTPARGYRAIRIDSPAEARSVAHVLRAYLAHLAYLEKDDTPCPRN